MTEWTTYWWIIDDADSELCGEEFFTELEDGRMLPLHEDFIVEIDEEARVLHVNLPFSL